MTKAELLKHWKEDGNEHSAAQLDVLFKSLCSVMAAELLAGGEVSLPGIGKLTTVKRTARECRNPRTGEKLYLPERLKPVFKASKEFKELLN